MKTFRHVLAEAASKARVVLFGRMNPPTSGHEENVNQAHALAQKHNAELHVIASHSHDPKKNPLSAEQKLTHLKRAFGHLSNTHLSTSSREAPSVLHAASAAHAAGVHHFVLAGGGDRAQGMHKLLHQYNGVKGPHGYYNFKKITVANTGERKEGISGTDMREHARAGNFDKFRSHLPSHIRSNEEHARELFHHVRSGMGIKEQTEPLNLQQIVEDSFSGLQGRVVYLGPNYVTVMLEDNTTFKRWTEDVDAVPHTGIPDDVLEHHLKRLHYCPGAQQAFRPLLQDSRYDQSVVMQALDNTAHYLDVEEYSEQYPDSIDDHAISVFVRAMQNARDALHALGVLDQHRDYMELHAHKMMNLAHGDAPEPKEESMQPSTFKNYMQEQRPGQPREDDLTDEDIKAIERHIDQLKWEDVRHLYADQEHEGIADAAEITEDLTAAQRIKKRFEFLKTKAKRELARKLALKRVSTQGRLKKRAIVHARNLIMQRLLRGRDKSKLSAAEKDRVENIVNRAKTAVVRISNRLMPKLRELELQRLKHQGVREQHVYDAEEDASMTVGLHDTDVTDNPALAANRARLAGLRGDGEGAPEVDRSRVVHKLKHYRKLEV